MDKNTLTGLLLMGAVILGFTWLNRPSEEEIAARRAEQAQAEQMAQTEPAAQAQQETVAADEGMMMPGEKAGKVVLANDLLRLEISERGGMITSARLNDYNSFAKGDTDTARVDLIRENDSRYGLTLTTASRRFDTSNYRFTPTVVNDSVVVMTMDFARASNPAEFADTTGMAQPKAASLSLRYTLRPGSYVVGVEVLQNGMSEYVPMSLATAQFDWTYKMARNETGRTFEERNSALSYKYLGDSPDELSSAKDDSENLNQRVKWIAFKNQFFSTVMIPRETFSAAEVEAKVLKDNADYVKDMKVAATIDYSSGAETAFAMDLFLGPNLYPLLSSLDDEIDTPEDLKLTSLIPLGWPIIRWINTLIIIPVFTWLGSVMSNYGIIILILTVFIKVILFPFTYKSLVSQAKMRVLAPEIKEINDKYPGQENAMKRSQKTMELYSKAGASPMSGCVPMLLQMPILIAMFWFFPSAIELRGESVLWARGLAARDVIFTLGFTIPWYGNHV
ncbi:MAG: membrane protein insertase YidC, partial [Muribaculaceae bacterium]|nr:membrane protein insertase YidC [Muribaculaceae bacterium]